LQVRSPHEGMMWHQFLNSMIFMGMKKIKLKNIIRESRIERKKQLLAKASILLAEIKKIAHEEFGV
jgi:hypothetical protein